MIIKFISQKLKLNRTLLIQLLFVIIAFIAMVWLSYIFMANIVRGSLLKNTDSVLDTAVERITSRQREFEGMLEGYAAETREMILQGAGAEELRENIDNLSRFALLDGGKLAGIDDFYGYFETLPEGPLLITGDRKDFPEDMNPKDLEWYQLAAGSDGIIETTLSLTETKGTYYTYAKSIFDDTGRRLGIVCMDVNMDIINRTIVNTALDQGGYGMMMNKNYDVIFHPNPDYVGINMSSLDFPPHIFVEDLRAGNEIFEQPLYSYLNEPAIAFFRILPNGWTLGFVTPKEQYYAEMNSMVVTLFLLGATLAVILCYILLRIDKARVKSDDENQKKSMFLANMSHEIRTPINAIVGMTAIGRAAGSNDRKDYCFSKIDSASKHLLGVINDILDISKIEANKIELSATDFNFEKMLQQAVNVANFRAEEKNQKLMVHIDKTIPRILYADDQRLVQVITNLLSNAIKFTPEEGAVKLNTCLLGEEHGVYTIQVEVVDTGIGISPEQQAGLFQAFHQAESSTTRKYGGTGLGLAISKSIVELMGGRIWVNSELGKGTKIAFTVKVMQGEESHFDLGRQGINWENVRILTVDDDPDILMYFQDMVSGFGVNCEVAESAGEALVKIEESGAFNIYFIDLRMPDVDGISLTKEIRAREKTPGNSIVIMISSADLSSVEIDAKKAGVNKFLLKPLFPSSVADVINECIGVVNEKVQEPLDINGIFAGHRILLAEDVDINREIVVTLLEPTELEIDCAENGLEAVRMFSEAPDAYDMIFMDIQMPEMDGFDATKQIRKLGYQKSETIPIVAMTANVFREDIERCLAAGMNDHLGKPLDMEEVLRKLHKYLLTQTGEVEAAAATSNID